MILTFKRWLDAEAYFCCRRALFVFVYEVMEKSWNFISRSLWEPWYSSNFIFWVCSLVLRKLSGELFSFFFQQNSRWPTYHMLLSWAAPLICSKEATYSGHMLITFWCDSDITYWRGLHEKLVTVLYFSIINEFWLLNLCGAGGDASFAPQAYLGDV